MPRRMTEDTLHDYFLRAIKAGVIDFNLRVVEAPQGQLDFYIHPQGRDGETADFTVSGGFVHKLECGAGSDRPGIQLLGS